MNARHPTRGRALAAASLAAAIAIHAAPARAEGESAAAEALFQQAKTLADQKKFAEACPKFAAAYKLDKTLGALLNLADCEEHLGQVASAWAHWGEAVELAEKTGDKRASFAAGRREPLVKRLPMIRIDVGAGKTSLSVYRDGTVVDPAAYGVPLPSDPGPHVISVRRGTEVLREQNVTVAEGQTSPVNLDLVAIEKAAPPPVTPVTVVAPLSNQKVIGYAVLGVGGVTLAAAGVLEILALTSKSAANASDACVNHFCTQDGYNSVTRARTFATAGQWVGIAGIVVGAVGLTLALTAPKVVPASRPSASLSAWVGPGSGGLGVKGAFR